jgi:hypothetical protein
MPTNIPTGEPTNQSGPPSSSDDEDDRFAVGWIIVGVLVFVAFCTGVSFALCKTFRKNGRPNQEPGMQGQREEQNNLANASPTVPSQPEAHIVEVAPSEPVRPPTMATNDELIRGDSESITSM